MLENTPGGRFDKNISKQKESKKTRVSQKRQEWQEHFGVLADVQTLADQEAANIKRAETLKKKKEAPTNPQNTAKTVEEPTTAQKTSFFEKTVLPNAHTKIERERHADPVDAISEQDEEGWTQPLAEKETAEYIAAAEKELGKLAIQSENDAIRLENLEHESARAHDHAIALENKLRNEKREMEKRYGSVSDSVAPPDEHERMRFPRAEAPKPKKPGYISRTLQNLRNGPALYEQWQQDKQTLQQDNPEVWKEIEHSRHLHREDRKHIRRAKWGKRLNWFESLFSGKKNKS